MLIDWFTVAAQVVNFLILLALLKYFLFDRVTQVMEKRKRLIVDRFDEAEEKEEAAEDKRKEYDKMKRELEKSRESRMREAEEEAAKRREDLLEEARRESESMRQKWRESLESEKESFCREFGRNAIRQVCSTAQRALADLADANLENQAVAVFLARFAGLDDGALPESIDNPPRIASGFDLSEDQRQKIIRTLSARRPDYPELRFETDPDLIFGVELLAGGKKISWNGRQYLKDLREHMEKSIEGEVHESESS